MATVNHFLDTRNSIDGNGIIKLRITHNRVQRDYSTKIKISPDDYVKVKNHEANGRSKNVEILGFYSLLFALKNEKKGIYSEGFIVRAKNIINQLGDNFSFDKFKELFDNYGIEEKAKTSNVILYLREKSIRLKENKQFSHGEDFSSLATSLKRYVEYLMEEYPKKAKGYKNGKGKEDKDYTLEFSHIDKAFMSDWCEWMQVEGKAPKKAGNTPTGSSITTVSIYARALRTAFNEAISNGIVEADKYPFGLRGFSIPSGKNIKKALSTKDLEMIKNYAPDPDSMEERSRDFWLFSYYGNGMNFKDLLSLRVKDLKDTDIYFQRAKTKGKSSDATLIRVRVNTHIKMVIEKYGNKSNRPNDLIFPYLNVTETPEKQRLSIHLFITSTNKYMNRIGVKLGIKSRLDTYEARHTFATQLMRNNAPSQIIGNSMGHSNPATTANYLGSFEKETEDTFLDML
jgi:integrase